MKEHSSVSQSVWQNWILEAIRKIRKQKQRPSDDRIYAAIKQHHNVTNEDLLVQLEKCVNQGVILKVINKGQVSYKDPARVMSRKLTISSESDPTKAIIKAVREMKNENGSSLKEIEKYLTESRILDLPDDLDFPSYLKSTVNRAAARGLLIQEGKLYKAPPKKDNDRTPSGRRRKTEEKELTPKKTPLPICSECLGTASKNRNGEPEDLSSCSGCGMSLHLSCVTGHHAAEFAILIGKGNCWYCEECLSCNECGAFKDEAYLLNCNACERCYHMLCLTPPVEKKPKAPWKCSFCLQSHKPGTSEKSKSSASTSGDINKTPSKSTNYHMDLKERKKQMKKQRLAARLEHSGRRKSSKVNVGAPESSSEDGNDSSPDSPLSPPVPPVGGFREETISKEKQKFFRLNSFYGIKGRGPSRCKAEGRPVRDISCSSSSSEQSSVENDTKKPLPEPVPSTKISPGHAKPKPLSSSTSNSVRKRTPEKRKSNVGGASGVSAKENVTVTPFSSLGSSLPCVTFGDLAKKCGNDKIDTAPQLPAVKLNASWLEKPKAIDTANDIPTKNNFTRIFSGKSSSVTKVPDEKPRPPTAAVSAPSTVDSKDTVKVTSHVKEPSSSESRSQCIKPSSSIVSRRSPVSKTEPEFSRHDTEELWGFAAAAARKEVTPVLHLDKEGAPSYPSYNVFLSNIWKSNSLRNTAVVADGHEASLDEDVERPPKKRDALSLSLSPSKLVKSAVISKQYEHVRRNMLSSNTPFPYVNQSGDVIPSDKDTIEKNLIAEATKTQHFQVCRHLNHLSVQSVSVPPSRPYNQSVIYSMSKILAADLPSGVTQKDIELYYEVQRRAKKATEALLPENTFDATPGSSGSEQPKCPAAIEFGKWEIQTWYSSPFPQEYARLPKLFICEFCLKYAKSKAILLRHLSKCKWRYPPGTEIYRTDNLSVFEVDGNVNKIYSQTLCLLAKLFLDHKTLYYDVEPFLFYVLTKNDEKGCHLVGYFSKEKHCQQKYNVSCIMTLPQYQRQGYGRFLIDFSYLLSRKEGKPGTPEKPLSDLGLVSYKAYWKSVILQYFHDHKSSKSVTIEKISLETGIMSHDIATALQELDMVRRLPNGDHVIVVDRKLVNATVEKAKNNKTRIVIEPVLLRWTPLLPNTVKQFEEGTRNDEEGESGANTNSEDEAERKAVVATTSKISPKKQNHAPTPKTGKKRKAAAPVTETPAAKKRASRLPVQEEVKHDTEDEVEQRPKKRRRTSYLEMSKIKDEKPSGVVLKSSRLSAAQAQESTAITSTPKTSRKSVKDVGLKSTTKKPETPIKKEPIREKSPVTEDEGCNRRSSRRLSKKTQIKEEKSERNRKTKPETPAKATKTEAKTKEPPPKEPTPKGRPPKMAKIKREPTPEVRTPPKEEEKEPVNIIVIRKKTPIKKKPKTASKRQHSLAAKKRWIARKAKQESSQAANDSGAMEVDDVQMPQLCPVTDVETANEIYHNPPVLDKKPECDSHDEEALESKDPKEEEKDEKDDKEDDNNEKNVEEKPSPENDSYQPEKMDTSEENSETQDKDNSSSHLPSTNPDESLPKSPARSPGTKDRADMDSYSCGDRMLQMSTYSQSSSSQSPSSLPSSRSMVSPQPLTPSSTDSHMSRDKSPSPHREKPDDTFKNTSTESVTEDDSKVKKEPEPECEPIERTKSEQAQPKNEQEQMNFRDENKKTDKDTQRDQTETKQSDDEKSDDMKIPPSQTTSMAEPTLPKNDVASPADKSEQTLDTKATAPSPPVPSHQHGVHEAVSAPESKNDSDVDAQKKNVTRMPEPPARSSHINDSTIPVPVPATTTVAPISTSNLPYQAPCTVASAMMYAQTPPMPMNDVAHTMQQRLEEMKYPQPVNMPSNVPVSSADDERAFRKLSTYYENQYANERDKMMASDKYRYPVDDKAPKDRPPSMDMNKSYMNEISNCGNVPYGSFAPMPGPLIMGPDKVVNLSDGRGYPPPSPHHGVMSNIHEPTPAMVISPVAPKMDSEQQERYPKNKRSKCTSPTKLEKKDAASAVAKNNSTHDSGLQGGMQNAKKYHDKEDRFYKESNLEQSLMKVKKMAQTEEDSKYKDRKCAKPPMVAGKDKKMTKSPSYSMDNTTTASAAMAPTPEMTIAKPPMTDEMKYKNMRRDVDEHMASVSNIDSGQHFVPGPMMKQPVPSPHGDSRSMGVYTPDSTTNSVHSVHGYGQYDMDAGHLNIESPNSISSNDMNTSGEPTRPPSAALPMHQMYIDSQQQAMLALHHLQQSHTMHGLSQLHTAPPPQHPPPAMISHHVVGKSSQSGRKNANNVNHHHHRSNKSVASGGSGSSGGSGHHHNMNNALHHRSTPPSVTNAHSPNTFVGAVNAPNNAVAAGIPHRSTPPGVNHQPQSRHHQIGPYSHGHHPATAAAMIAQSGYLGVSQMPTGSYPPSVPVTTVIQHRMTPSSDVAPPPSPVAQTQQRLGSSPCSTSSPTGFYIQSPMHHSPHMHSSGGGAPPISSTPPSGGPSCPSRMQNSQAAMNACSLAKLQQLTNGFDVLPPGHGGTMTPSSPINLTPPPAVSSHGNMTTPPVAHHLPPQANLANYKLFAAGNIPSSATSPMPSVTTSSGTSSSSGRSSSRGSHHAGNASNSVSRAAAAAAAAGMSPNVTINPNLMSRYGGNPYGYQMPGQPAPGAQTLSYITNGAPPAFINQTQLPVRMGVMNMAQNQYGQDPTQNSMYSAATYYPSFIR